MAELHIQPILVETYTKHTQTDIALEHDIVLKVGFSWRRRAILTH